MGDDYHTGRGYATLARARRVRLRYGAAMNVWPGPHILKFVHVDGLSAEDSVTQDDWTALLNSAATDPVLSLSLRGGGDVSGNLVSFSESEPAWVAAFAETAMAVGLTTVWWVSPEQPVSPEDASLLTGMGVVVCPRVRVQGLKLGPMRTLFEQQAERLKGVLGSVPALVRVDAEDGLILQEARRVGFHRAVLDGSGINPPGRRVWTCRKASDTALECAWLEGAPRASVTIAAHAVSLKKVRARLGL